MRAQNFPANPSTSDAQAVAREFSPPSSRLVQRRKRSTDRSALIAAATELFSRYGFKDTSLREIARTAGCSLSAVRREFGGKSEVMESVLRARGPSALPRLQPSSDNTTLREGICQLIEWEAGRMWEHRELIDSILPQDSNEPELTRIAGNLSLSSSDFIAERLKCHRNVAEAERQFLLYAIQSVGFALGFVRPHVIDPVCAKTRVRRLAGILAESIERHQPPRNSLRFSLQSLLPV
jgi:AcrR family transcriptional regulator